MMVATGYPHDDPGGRMKFMDVELPEKRTDIGARDKELVWCGDALRLPGGRATAPERTGAKV